MSRGNRCRWTICFDAISDHPTFQDIYSVRIDLDYRALGVMKKDRIVWSWIGNHSEYGRLI